jgi:hypothetical protein
MNIVKHPDTIDVPVSDVAVAVPAAEASALAAVASGNVEGYSFNGAGVFAVFHCGRGEYRHQYRRGWTRRAYPIDLMNVYMTVEEARAAFRASRKGKDS